MINPAGRRPMYWWYVYATYSWPPPHRPDCHSSMFLSEAFTSFIEIFTHRVLDFCTLWWVDLPDEINLQILLQQWEVFVSYSRYTYSTIPWKWWFLGGIHGHANLIWLKSLVSVMNSTHSNFLNHSVYTSKCSMLIVQHPVLYSEKVEICLLNIC